MKPQNNWDEQPAIYTITAIKKDGSDSRCFGFEMTLEQAKIDVQKNYGSMDECIFDWIVIEKQERGIHSFAIDLQWYAWEHPEGEEGHWIECQKPKGERFDFTCKWNGIG